MDGDNKVVYMDRTPMPPEPDMRQYKEETFNFFNGASVTIKAPDNSELLLPEAVFLLESVKHELLTRQRAYHG